MKDALDTGTRLFRVGVLVLMVGVLAAVGWLAFAADQFTGSPGALYTIDVPTVVVQEQIPANRNGEIDVIVTRCLNTNEAVLFGTSVDWISDGGESVSGDSNLFQQRNAAGGAGCEGSNDPPIQATVQLPEGGLPPGTWKFVSTIDVRSANTGELLDTELNVSETFRVVGDG